MGGKLININSDTNRSDYWLILLPERKILVHIYPLSSKAWNYGYYWHQAEHHSTLLNEFNNFALLKVCR